MIDTPRVRKEILLFWNPVEDDQSWLNGDTLPFSIVGIYTEGETMIHAYQSKSEPSKVVEHRFDAAWKSQIVGVFRRKELAHEHGADRTGSRGRQPSRAVDATTSIRRLGEREQRRGRTE